MLTASVAVFTFPDARSASVNAAVVGAACALSYIPDHATKMRTAVIFTTLIVGRTTSLVAVQTITFPASAFVAPNGVDAELFAQAIVTQALICIYAVVQVLIKLKSVIAATLVASERVVTLMNTSTIVGLTFIDIETF